MFVLSVRPSNAWIVIKRKKNQSSPDFCTPCERPFSLFFVRKRMVGGGRPLLAEILGQSDRIGSKSPIFDLFLFVAPQPYDLAKN